MPRTWLAYTDEDLWDANVKLSRFRRWAKKNPAILHWMWDKARYWVSAGMRSSSKHLVDTARWDSGIRIVDVDGPVRISSDYSPIIARIMVKSIPGAENVFTIQKSVFDLLDEDQVPRFDARGNLVWDDAE